MARSQQAVSGSCLSMVAQQVEVTGTWLLMKKTAELAALMAD
jgi:hypothetical protein